VAKSTPSVLVELCNSSPPNETQADFIERVLDLILKNTQAESAFIAAPDEINVYRVYGKSRLDERLHHEAVANLEGLLISGIDSISNDLLESIPVLGSKSTALVRSPAGFINRILLIVFGSVATSALAVCEPYIRLRLEIFRSNDQKQRARSLLDGMHESSRNMVRHLLTRGELLCSLLNDARKIMNAAGCAVLIPTDEQRNSYIVKAHTGFTEPCRPIPDALFNKAFEDYELNDRSAILYRAKENEAFLLVPLTQRNEVNGILLFSGKDSDFHYTGEDSRRIAEIFGDWVSLANENATLFERFASSQSEWENTFDSIADPIYIIGNDYRLKKLNKSLASYAMKSIKVPLDPYCYRYLFNQSTICPWCPVPKSLETGMPEIVEAPLFTTGLWQIQSFPYTDKDETRIGSIHVLRDITLLKQMQEQLIETEKLASAGKLISGVAHEVRNPLFGISATVRALANELKDKQDIQPYLDIITSETTRLNRLMEDLLNYTRPVKIDKNASDLTELVNEVVEYFKQLTEGQDAYFSVIGEKIPPMNIDRNKMKQVLFNLFENGIQHANGKPRVDVFLQHLELADPPEVHLVIKDNGAGISADNLTKVFDPFFTTRQKGTGLGLSIVRKVIHDHGGRIAVESHPGIGTTFRITLPVSTRV
jgi:two-component system, NtrC family, sensor kinase